MKRITKQNLNDLAKVMPVLNEKQQFENVGGTYYVSNSSYEGLGFVGNSDVIYLISESAYENAAATSDEYAGIALMSCDSITQQMTFAAFAFQTIGYNGITEVVSLTDDPRPIFYDTYSGRLKFNVATSSGVWGCKAALEAELHKVRASMSGNSSSSSGGDSNSGSGGSSTRSGSASGNISGGISGSASGNEMTPEEEEKAILARVETLDNELEVVKLNQGVYDQLREDQMYERRELASRLIICWDKQGHTGMGYTIEDAYKKCKAEMPK